MRLADYGGRQYFDSFKMARQLMEKFIVQSEILSHPIKHWEEMRKITQLDNVLKHNGTLSFRDAQMNEAKRNIKENKHRMPDGEAEKAFPAAFAPHSPQ